MVGTPGLGVGQGQRAFCFCGGGQLLAHKCRAVRGAEAHPQHGSLFRSISSYGDSGLCQRRRVHKQVGHAGGSGGFEPDLAVESAVGQVVDDEAEWRQGRVFPRVQPHGQQIFCVTMHKICNFQCKRRVAAQMFPHELAVQVDGSLVGRAVKPQKQPRRVRQGQRAAVAADHLVVCGVCVVERQFAAGMGQTHSLAWHGCAGAKGIAPDLGKFPIIAKAVFHRTAIPSHKIATISSSACV